MSKPDIVVPGKFNRLQQESSVRKAGDDCKKDLVKTARSTFNYLKSTLANPFFLSKKTSDSVLPKPSFSHKPYIEAYGNRFAATRKYREQLYKERVAKNKRDFALAHSGLDSSGRPFQTSSLPDSEKEVEITTYLKYDGESFVPMAAEDIDPTKPYLVGNDGTRIQIVDNDMGKLRSAIYTLRDRGVMFPDGISHIINESYAKKGYAEDEKVIQFQGKQRKNVREKVSDVGKGIAAAATLGTLATGTIIADTHAQALPTSPSQGIHESIPANFQTSEKAYKENIVRYQSNVSNPDKGQNIEASTNITETLSNILVSREYLEQNPQDIRDIKDIVDQNGNVIKQYVIVSKKDIINNQYVFKNYIYETHIGDDGKFTEYKQTSLSKIPMESPLSIATSADGRIIIVGGEEKWISGQTKVVISYDSGATWQTIPWNYVNSGATSNLIRITDNVYLGNNGNYEGGISQFFININPDNMTSSIKAASIAAIEPTNLQAGSARDLKVASIDSQTAEIIAISAGSYYLQEGFNEFKINYETAQGTVKNIKSVKVDGVDTPLGYLYGGDTYTDSEGHTHFVSNSDVNSYYFVVDIDTSTLAATRKSIANLPNSIPGYMDGSMTAYSTNVIKGDQGEINTWLGGNGISSGIPHDSRALVANVETGVSFGLFPNRSSNVWEQKGMVKKIINNQTGLDIIIQGDGEVFIPINPDGSPIPDAVPLFLGNGLNTILPEPTPPPPPQFRVILPLVQKGYSGGW